MVLLAAGVTPTLAAPTPDQGRKGAWSWDRNVASTEIGSGIRLVVAFSADDNCDDGRLMVYGNRNISELTLTVDGQFFGNTSMAHVPGTEIAVVRLPPSILSSIKNGDRAKVTTNVGSARFALSGSAKAINSAYGNCRNQAQSLVASAPSNESRSTTESTGFFGKKVRPDGSEILAINNVVFVFSNIQIGDDILLEELVREMEDADIPFKSVIFLQNGGGALATAARMGKFIRSKGANTAVGGYPMDDGKFPYCASACVYAFAGGVRRTIYLPARIGMHQASLRDGSAGTMEEGQQIVAETYQYLSQMGVDPAIVIEGSKSAADEMWWLSGYEAKGYGLATRITKPHELGTLPTDRAAPQPADSDLISRFASSPARTQPSDAGTEYPDRYSRVAGPSFRCDGTLRTTESIICDDQNLARADGMMGAIYRDLRSLLDKDDAEALRTAQRGWLRQRSLTCPTNASDVRVAEQRLNTVSCLHRATERRIAELWEILKSVEQSR